MLKFLWSDHELWPSFSPFGAIKTIQLDMTMVYVGKNWLKVWNTLWNSEFPPMELLERSEYQLYFWGKCWVQSSVDNLEKSIITSIILNPTFFVSLKKQNCVKKNTHLNPQDPFLFNIFYLQLKRDRDTDHRVVDESQQEDLHISSRDWDVYYCLVPKRYDGTPWLLFF